MHEPQDEGPVATRPGRLALRSVAAGAVLVAGSLLFREAFSTKTPFELLADRVISLTPAGLFSALLDLLQYWGKPFLLVMLAMAWLAIGALIALTAQVGARRNVPLQSGGDGLRRRILASVGVGLAALALSAVAAPWAAGAGPLAVEASTSAWRFVTAAVASSALYGVALFAIAAPARARGHVEPEMRKRLERRHFLKWAGLSLVVVGGATVLSRNVGGLLSNAGPVNRASALPGTMKPEITPVDEFYVISKNFSDPRVDAARWRLVVDGLVERPADLTYEEVKALGAAKGFVTLECISNEVGGPLISNAEWTGVAMASLLEHVGAKPEARYLVSYAADGYHESLPIDDAREGGVLLAYEMNGEPLTDKHGFPSRLLIPGRYGMKSTKWVERLELSVGNKLGYWEERGWDEPAVVKTMSRIDVPANRATLPLGPTTVGGVAYAGKRGIGGVQVSVDGGETWADAKVRDALSQAAWALWTFPWEPQSTGSYRLLVRAADGNGDLQTRQVEDPFPNGASGYHSVGVRVV